MGLAAIFKEREKLRVSLCKEALKEAERLGALLRERFTFDRLYITGSIATGRFRKGSDIDFVIEGLPVEDFFKAYSFLLEESHFPVDLKPFEDLVESLRVKVLSGGIKIG